MKQSIKYGFVLVGFLLAGLVFLPIAGGNNPSIAESAGLPVEVTLQATPLEQPPVDAAVEQTVTFAGGWVLSSDHAGFGGFSGLVVDGDTSSILAISDKGDWWQAPFDIARALPPGTGSMRSYTLGVIADKEDLDAESLIRFQGGYLVSFEQNHRLEFMTEVGGRPSPPSGLADIDFSGVSNNSGMEAIAFLPSGSLLAFTERGQDTGGRLKAWLVSADSVADLYFAPPANFAPTDAAVLPNGDVLVLLRKYSAVEGVAVKVMHVEAAKVLPGAVLSGREILHLTPEGPVDNMEGLDVVTLGDDIVRLVMISDDNFNPLQRTLLMMFDYKYQ